MIDDRPSIAALQAAAARDSFSDEAVLIEAAPVLLEIAAAAKALGPELVYLQGPLSDRLRDALAKVQP